MTESKKYLTILMLSFFLSNCGSDDSELTREIAELNQLVDELESLDLEEPVDEIDRNGDGRPDFFYEIDIETEILYQLVDRNFDGRVDESWAVDDIGFIRSGRFDADFDGILETEYVWDEFQYKNIFSDTDSNGISDQHTKLVDGNIVYMEKYYPASENESARIGRVQFSVFGFPVSTETIELTSQSESEFELTRREH